MAFGESCSIKSRSHEPIENMTDGRRFRLGIFISIDSRTGQHMLHDGEYIKLARTVLTVPDGSGWDKEALTRVGPTPYDLHKPREPEVVFREQADEEKVDFKDKVSMARQVDIKPSDTELVGMTRGCPWCEHQMAYSPDRTSKPHSKRYGDRIMGELSKTAAGREDSSRFGKIGPSRERAGSATQR